MDPTSQNNTSLESGQSSGSRIVHGMIIGAIVAALFIVILTIVGELYEPLKSLLKEQHHHHWVGKGIWASVLFIVVSIVSVLSLKNPSLSGTARLLKTLAWVLALSLIVLLIFFAYEYSSHY